MLSPNEDRSGHLGMERDPEGREEWGELPDPCEHEVCVVGVSLCLARQHGAVSTSLHCCEPKIRAPSPESHVSLSSLGLTGEPLQRICVHLFLDKYF